MTRGRWALIVVAVIVPLVAWLALGFFGVHTLFIDERVDEELTAEGQLLRTGTFTGFTRYSVEGTANVIELADGTRQLQLVDFQSTNGPDLYVYLSAASVSDPVQDHDDDFVDLGRLRGNLGNQQYDIPEGVDIDQYATVVIWCQRFSVGFGAAGTAPR